MKVVSLLYHDVVEEKDPDASGFPGSAAARYKLSPQAFEAHMAMLASSGVRCHTIGEVLAGPELVSPCLLTFDDGGRSAHDRVASVIESFGWRGHFFLATDYLDTPSFLDREQVIDLKRRGHVMGSHSATHPSGMARLPAARIEDEWRRSLERLSELFDEPVETASVPAGSYSRRVARIAARAGVRVLFTSEPTSTLRRVDGCAILGRFCLRKDSPASLSRHYAEGRLWPRVKDLASWNVKKLAKTAGGAFYEETRERVLRRRG